MYIDPYIIFFILLAIFGLWGKGVDQGIELGKEMERERAEIDWLSSADAQRPENRERYERLRQYWDKRSDTHMEKRKKRAEQARRAHAWWGRYWVYVVGGLVLLYLITGG